MTHQRDAFLASEGDGYFARNANHPCLHADDPVLKALNTLNVQPKRVLEIGSSNGWRMMPFKQSGAYCAGVDPSPTAVLNGKPAGLDLRVGASDSLPFSDGEFDLVIFGFCLYLVDPPLLFKSVGEADRVLVDGGVLAIYDFIPQKEYFNEYGHAANLKSFKMEFSKLFVANPAYSLVHREIETLKKADDRMGVDVLVKDQIGAFQKNPYGR